MSHGTIDFNWLGVAFVSDKLPMSVSKEVEAEMEALRVEAEEKFAKWLDDHDLEQAMGVIVKKGSVPQPKVTAFDNFTRDRDYRIYHPSPDGKFVKFTIYDERDLNKPLAFEESMTTALQWVARQYP